MNFQQRKAAFIKLGQRFLTWIASNDPLLEKAYLHNNWFTVNNTKRALEAWAHLLTDEKLDEWLSAYSLNENHSKLVAIIMAGNIPLVGLHDLLCVLITNNKAIVKCSADDRILMQAAIAVLKGVEPGFNDSIEITEDRLPKIFDAVIATGSNNTNRYFEYYFKDKPHLLRKNRNSVAVLTGNETPEDMQRLADDIFVYFGLGCRNVSKIYVPHEYDFANLYEQMGAYSHVIDHNKYANNYTYHKSIFLMNLTPHLDNGLLLLKESDEIASPLSTLFFSYYLNADALQETLERKADQIQCKVGKTSGYIPFGKSQEPEWWDYADGVDTLAFLQGIGS